MTFPPWGWLTFLGFRIVCNANGYPLDLWSFLRLSACAGRQVGSNPWLASTQVHSHTLRQTHTHSFYSHLTPQSQSSSDIFTSCTHREKYLPQIIHLYWATITNNTAMTEVEVWVREIWDGGGEIKMRNPPFFMMKGRSNSCLIVSPLYYASINIKAWGWGCRHTLVASLNTSSCSLGLHSCPIKPSSSYLCIMHLFTMQLCQCVWGL